MKNIFLEKSYTKCGGETILTLFSKIKAEHISESIGESFMKLVFTVCQVMGYQNILKLNYRPLVFTLHKASLKNKKRSGTILPFSFCT